MDDKYLDEKRRADGNAMRREVLGAGYADSPKKDDPFYSHFLDFTVDHCWGNVWLRPGLDKKTRSMLNIAMLSAMGRWHELAVHTRGALNNGVTEQEIAEILLQAGVYAGVPMASEGFRTCLAVVEAWRKEHAEG
jgi:4-carboxymuconolactone decarboxylase